MSYDRQGYNEKVLTRLYEAIYEFQNSIDEVNHDADEALAEVIFHATKYPAIVSSKLDELIEQSKAEPEL